MPGLSHKNADPQGFLGLIREDILLPIAADSNYFSSATDGGAQAAIDISASVDGDVLNRSATGKRPLFYGRLPTITTVDASGTNLSCTVRLTCKRFGKTFYQDITATGAGGGQTVAGTRLVDEITAMVLLDVTNRAASDTLAVGFDGQWLGLRVPFKSKDSIRMVYKIASGTPDAAGPKMSSDLTAAMVMANKDSAIDMYTLYSSSAIAVTDRYLVEYIGDGEPTFFNRSGLRFG